MKATDILMDEHELILRGVAVLDTMARLAHAGLAFPAEDARAMLAFIRELADGRHHAKEERVLFPALEAAGIPREGGPIGCMLAEHEQGRAAVRAMADAVAAFDSAPDALAAFARAARTYVQLLSQHICKENHALFRMACQVLTTSQDDALVAAFAEQERALDASFGDASSFAAVILRLEAVYATPLRPMPPDPGRAEPAPAL